MTTFTVTNIADSGTGSLRQAIEDANATAGLDTIEFDEALSGQKITLTSGELEITDDLSISGLGADELTVSGNNNSRVFKIDDANDENQIEVTINDLAITKGVARGEGDDDGGGILTVEDLTVSNSIISDNIARNNGGGIWNQRGTISENPIDPLLGPLQDNGGFTQTHALLAGSPAIDAGNPDFESPPEFDQRGVGFPRVLDGDGDGTATVDIGSFELANVNVIDGTSDNDLLVGTPASDRISGFDGNDLLFGRDGDDILNGGSGNDNLYGNNSNDSLVGGSGQDFLVGGTGDDLFDGGSGNDNLISSSGSDRFVLRQDDGQDTIFDYLDGTDSFLLAKGLAFEDLTITQGVGQSSIGVTDTSENLAVLLGVNANIIGAEDFFTLG